MAIVPEAVCATPTNIDSLLSMRLMRSAYAAEKGCAQEPREDKHQNRAAAKANPSLFGRGGIQRPEPRRPRRLRLGTEKWYSGNEVKRKQQMPGAAGSIRGSRPADPGST